MTAQIIPLNNAGFQVQVFRKGTASRQQDIIRSMQEQNKQLEAMMKNQMRLYNQASEMLEKNLRVLELLTAEPQERIVIR